ncbi:MAG: PGF-pre-PGF domain-containing protein, partial [Candidatus Goldbacteria bacterium]|nr:PGF-pre-PGF domain-containing protein [Candidatus Goldiibacteriota bacterium]
YNNLIYNNYFNNSQNFLIEDSSNFWNTTKTPEKNIIGGQYIAGNYWATPDGNGFSENITKCNPGTDGICKNRYELDSDNIDYHPLTAINLKISNITYSPLYPYTSDEITISADISSTSITGKIKINIYDGNNLIYTIDSYSISSGQTKTLSFILKNPFSGIHNIKIVIDANNTYPEINEDDNILSTEIYVRSKYVPSSSTFYSISSDYSGGSAATNRISEGQSISYNFSLPKLDIQEIILTFTNSVSGISIKVNQIQEPPTGIISPSGELYAFITVDKTNFRDEDISSTTIKFRVPISWINENNINESSIVLYKYENNKWIQLQTSLISRDGNYLYFSAISQGLSLYSIVGQVKTTSQSPVAEEKPSTKPTTSEKPIDYIWIIALSIIVILIILLTVVLFNKYKQVK